MSAEIIVFPGVRVERRKLCLSCGRAFFATSETLCPLCRQAARVENAHG